MKPLKEAIQTKHKEAEKMLFNIKMFRGQLTIDQYSQYLLSQLQIFSTIEENFEMPHEGLRRKEAVIKDLKSIGVKQLETPNPATSEYVLYLKSLSQEEINPHIYLNYLAIMFGGQMMKKNTPGPGNMYDFEDMNESAANIRAIQKDEWADQVNKGFDFMINIFKELENIL